MNSNKSALLVACGYYAVSAVVNNSIGLHSRPSMGFVGLASGYNGKVYLAGNGVVADAKNIMEVMMCAVPTKGAVQILIEPKEDKEHEVLGRRLKHFLETCEG